MQKRENAKTLSFDNRAEVPTTLVKFQYFKRSALTLPPAKVHTFNRYRLIHAAKLGINFDIHKYFSVKKDTYN